MPCCRQVDGYLLLLEKDLTGMRQAIKHGFYMLQRNVGRAITLTFSHPTVERADYLFFYYTQLLQQHPTWQ